jgi:hypothetical protein
MKMNDEQKKMYAAMTPEQKKAYDALPNDTLKAQTFAGIKAKAAKAAEETKKTKEPKVPKVHAADSRVITLVVEKNPKRETSAAHARFALYKTGMTVDAYIATCADKLAKIQPGVKRDARADIAWDVKHKHITVSE